MYKIECRGISLTNWFDSAHSRIFDTKKEVEVYMKEFIGFDPTLKYRATKIEVTQNIYVDENGNKFTNYDFFKDKI